MNGNVKISLAIYKCMPGVMALYKIGTEKYHKVSETYPKVSEIKVKSSTNDGI